MPKQDIVVMGASAGGVETLKRVAAGFPADLPAAVCVVLHIGHGYQGRSLLPEILTRAGPLPAHHPADGEELRPGRIYVAPPDRHLELAPGRVRVVRGPRENMTRPAINPLFRTAADTYHARVAGVILTGMLDDGVAGLAEIKRRGGVAVVQDPATAMFPTLPQEALEHVDVDYTVPADEIAALIARLATTERSAMEIEEPVQKKLLEIECPECTGPLWEERQGKVVEYRCRVGHAYSPLTLVQDSRDAVERSLWRAVIDLEEAASISERVAAELDSEYAEDARLRREQAAVIKQMLGVNQRT